MLTRRLALARPLTRFTSTISSVPRPPAPAPDAQPPVASPAVEQQAPNYPLPWSTGQNPRPHAYASPRFEQANYELQPRPLAAIGMVEQDPVRLVNGRRAACDGGGGPLGHPKVFINLDKPGPKACGYCGIRYEQAHEHH
ncbi:hypothetical protein Q5752_004609 [Cryptotrichosporon argae]